MTQNIERFAKAMTAIAAVLASTSTPALAQETTAPPDTAVETPATADPLAPEPAATESAVPPAPKPKVETSRATTQQTKSSASASTTRATARRASAPAPVTTPAATPVAAAATPAPPPVEAQPPLTALPAAPPEVAPAPVNNTPDTLSELMADEMLPAAGAAALGLLALGGAGIAMRRRKRRREDEEFEARQQYLDQAETEAEPVLELDRTAEVRPVPAFARAPAPVHDPVPDKKAPVTELPNGFDLSRFGRHVQAAYRGPTPDNPSLSLKNRLRRAAALDQQDRQLGEQRAAEMPATIPARGNWQARPDADFLFRRAGEQVKRPVEHH